MRRAQRLLREGRVMPIRIRMTGRHDGVLTDRLMEVLYCIVCGEDSRQAIGEELGITAVSARSYIERIYEILGVCSAGQAASAAWALGYVEGEAAIPVFKDGCLAKLKTTAKGVD